MISPSVQDTSLNAYMDISPVLAERQQRVYLALKANHPMTNMELSQYLGWTINCVTPRVLELRKKKLVTDAGCRPCTVTGRWAWSWVAR